MLLKLVGRCWIKFETGQTLEPASANISIVSRSSKRGPTMLRSFAQHIQQWCAGARAPKRGMYGIVGICVQGSFVFSSNNALRVEKANCPFLESLEVITKLIRKDIVIDLTSILVHYSYTCNVELWCL